MVTLSPGDKEIEVPKSVEEIKTVVEPVPAPVAKNKFLTGPHPVPAPEESAEKATIGLTARQLISKIMVKSFTACLE